MFEETNIPHSLAIPRQCFSFQLEDNIFLVGACILVANEFAGRADFNIPHLILDKIIEFLDSGYEWGS